MSLEYPRAYVFADNPGSAGTAQTSGLINGDDYFVVRIDRDDSRLGQEVTNTQYANGKGHFFRKKKFKPYHYKLKGFVKEAAFSSTITAAVAPLQFIPKNWSERTSADYLVVIHGSGEYELWPDENGTLQNVARGFWEGANRVRDRDEGNFYYIRGTFTISWS